MLELIGKIIFSVVVIGGFVWLFRSSNDASTDDAIIDPADPKQIGTLIGLMGGSVEDAAVAQYALRRFEDNHGRKATVKEMGIVAGMMGEL